MHRLDPLTPLRLHRLLPLLQFATVSLALRNSSTRSSPRQLPLLLNTPTIPPTPPIPPTISSHSIRTCKGKRCNWLGEKERRGWKGNESSSSRVKVKEGLESSEVPVPIFFFLILESSGRWDPVLRGRDLDFPNPFSIRPFHRFLSALFLVYRLLRRSRFQDSKICLRFSFLSSHVSLLSFLRVSGPILPLQFSISGCA